MTRETQKATNALWGAQEIERAVRGTMAHSQHDWQASGVSIDSRTIKRGDLFVALAGERYDGHDFVAKAFANGAEAAIVSRIPDGVPEDWPCILVDDTSQALTDLAGVSRHRNRGKMLAVTGSVGKTGTKDALRLCLGAQAPAYASEGSLNNHIGVPLSLARMPRDTHYNVFELGMNPAGGLTDLSKLVTPDIAIITNVHGVHLDYFADEEAIADAKAEVFAGMAPNGTAILNSDSQHYARLVAHAKTSGVRNILSFSADGNADAYLVDAQVHATSSAVSAVVMGHRLIYSLSVPGKHWVINSLAVLLAAAAAGADVPTSARALSYLKPGKGLGSRSRIATPFGAFTLIDDSNSASPIAMRAAISVLDKTDPAPGGRRVAVLGDMLELGANSAGMHSQLVRDLRQAGIDTVHCCGPMMHNLYEVLPRTMRGHYAPDSTTLAPLVANDISSGDVVLVKGSRGSHMRQVIEELTALCEEEPVFNISTAVAVNDA